MIRSIIVIDHAELAESLAELWNVPAQSLPLENLPPSLPRGTLVVLPTALSWPRGLLNLTRELEKIRAAGAAETAVFVRGELRFVSRFDLLLIPWIDLWEKIMDQRFFLTSFLYFFLGLPVRLFLDLLQWFRWPNQLGPIVGAGFPRASYVPWYTTVCDMKRRFGSLGYDPGNGRGLDMGLAHWVSAGYGLLGLLGFRKFNLLCFTVVSLLWIAAVRHEALLALAVFSSMWSTLWIRYSKPSNLGWVIVFAGLWFPLPLLPLIIGVALAGMPPFILGVPLLLLQRFLAGGLRIDHLIVSGVLAVGFLLWQRQVSRGTTLFGDIRYQASFAYRTARKESRFFSVMPIEMPVLLALIVAAAALLVGASGRAGWLVAWPLGILLAEIYILRIADFFEHQMLLTGALTALMLEVAPPVAGILLGALFFQETRHVGALPWGIWDLDRRIRSRLKDVPAGARVVEEVLLDPEATRAGQGFARASKLYTVPLGHVWNATGHTAVTGISFVEISHTTAIAHSAFSDFSSEEEFDRALEFLRPDVVAAFSDSFHRRLESRGGRLIAEIPPDLNGFFTGNGRHGKASVSLPLRLYRMDQPAALVDPPSPVTLSAGRLSFVASKPGPARVRMNASAGWAAFQGSSPLRVHCDGGDLMVYVPEPGPVELRYSFWRHFLSNGLQDSGGRRITTADLVLPKPSSPR